MVGVFVGVNVDVGVRVEVEDGVIVFVGVGVSGGPNNLPGPQPVLKRLKKINR